jgi:hypothetical protein
MPDGTGHTTGLVGAARLCPRGSGGDVQDDQATQIIGPIFFGVGLLLLVIAIFLIYRTRRFLARAVDTTGTVISFVTSHSSEGGVTYKPVVQFQVGGQVVQFVDSMGSSPPSYEVGEVLPVKYDPLNPQKARPNKPFRLWFAPGLLILMGAIFGGIGAAMLLAA